MRKIIQIITIVILSIYGIYCAYFFIANPAHPTYLDCGTIRSKSNDEVVIKYGTKTELYLNVDFRETGFKAVEVSPTTYFQHKVGDYVCFDLDRSTSGWYAMRFLSGAIILVVIVFGLIVWFIMYLTNVI